MNQRCRHAVVALATCAAVVAMSAAGASIAQADSHGPDERAALLADTKREAGRSCRLHNRLKREVRSARRKAPKRLKQRAKRAGSDCQAARKRLSLTEKGRPMWQVAKPSKFRALRMLTVPWSELPSIHRELSREFNLEPWRLVRGVGGYRFFVSQSKSDTPMEDRQFCTRGVSPDGLPAGFGCSTHPKSLWRLWGFMPDGQFSSSSIGPVPDHRGRCSYWGRVLNGIPVVKVRRNGEIVEEIPVVNNVWVVFDQEMDFEVAAFDATGRRAGEWWKQCTWHR